MRWYVIKKSSSDELYHHGVQGQIWGIKNGPPYPVGSNNPSNLVDRNNISKIKKYKMAIIGEIHDRKMISYYDKLLSEKKPEYFICEFADTDRCYNRKQLKDRMDNATDGKPGNVGADYQYNYWAYNLAYKHNCKLIGCNPTGLHKGNFDRMHDEDAFREDYMLKTLKEFEGKNCVVQLGDHHLRSIPISKSFLKYTGDTVDDRGVVSDLTVDNASPIWEYFKNKKDTCICREDNEYKNEVYYEKSLRHYNERVKAQK